MNLSEDGSDKTPVERGRGDNSRGSKVYKILLERMRSGDLKPGTRMREDETARELGVSRTPVREAFARLFARGLVESAKGGWTVKELTRSQVMELYSLRAVLEGAAARFAAQNASPSDLAALGFASDAFSNVSGGAGARAKANMVFHEAIYEAAHNSYLSRMLEELNDSLALLPDTTFSVDGRTQAATLEHRAIVEGIEARDADKAEAAARRHIENAMQARLEMIFKKDLQEG
ncbi:GntR family transcriptional regulator [Roseibium sp.]|uniref:GntR family transcriptional regulator n=1 Tax=Roseibium sp. TaxID=1936156 RepID=UPI003A9749AC